MKSFKLLLLLFIACLLPGVKNVQATASLVNTLEQPVPKPIRKIVDALSKANVFVLNEPDSTTAFVKELEQNYFLLSKLATSNELENLIRTHKNAVVRIYAFKALTTQVHDISATIMAVINNDTSSVECIKGDKRENIEVKNLAQNFLN